MLFSKFYSAIRDLLGKTLAGNEDELSKLNPDKIYIENVRSVFGTSTWMAEEMCETAVLQGLFRRHVEVLSPSAGNALVSAGSIDELPETVTYFRRDDDDFVEEEVRTSELPVYVYYSLNDAKAKEARIAI